MEVKNNFLDIAEYHTMFSTDIKCLYVRQSYLDLHKLISNDHADTNAIITGTPGVGKSMFAVYKLYLALREGKTVVFHHLVTNTTYVFDTQMNRAFTTTALYGADPYLDEKSTVYLYDAGTKSLPQYRPFIGCILLFSLPERRNYADIQKMRAMVFYMPTWSWSEISHIIQKEERDEATARQMFDMFGGVPHHVFIDTESCRMQSTKMLNDLCTRVTTDFLLSIGRQLLSIGQQSIKESNRLLHVIVQDGNYSKAKTDFVSKYGQRKVFETLTKRRKDNVL